MARGPSSPQRAAETGASGISVRGSIFSSGGRVRSGGGRQRVHHRARRSGARVMNRSGRWSPASRWLYRRWSRERGWTVAWRAEVVFPDVGGCADLEVPGICGGGACQPGLHAKGCRGAGDSDPGGIGGAAAGAGEKVAVSVSTAGWVAGNAPFAAIEAGRGGGFGDGGHQELSSGPGSRGGRPNITATVFGLRCRFRPCGFARRGHHSRVEASRFPHRGKVSRTWGRASGGEGLERSGLAFTPPGDEMRRRQALAAEKDANFD